MGTVTYLASPEFAENLGDTLSGNASAKHCVDRLRAGRDVNDILPTPSDLIASLEVLGLRNGPYKQMTVGNISVGGILTSNFVTIS